MKRICACILVLGFCAGLPGLSWAAKRTKTVTTAPSMTTQQREAIKARALEQFNSQTWTIYLTAQGVKKPRVETDVLTFTGSTVISQNLSSQGYSSSNFTLSVLDDGNAVFETVQRTEEGDLALWRGTLYGNKIVGILNLRPQGKVATIYSFTSLMPVVSATSEPEPEPRKKKR
ncbi:MAG: hypothetical protein AMJ95_07145 [Omnitrophica WOR_2 bacterium SM23_72]|nr:MAG: hypothetical protein AMJ95_07145 [Omnitrophica WOR_2 bacterium SM23_72]